MQAFTFEGLTPDFIWQALLSIGIRAESGLLPLNSYENRVYQFSDEQGLRYVVKFYRPQRWNPLQIQEEHQFAYQLQQAEIPVVAPLLINGESLHNYQNYCFTLFDSVGGRQFEVDNFDQLESVGRYLGRIHKLTQNQQFTHRPTIGVEEYLYQPREILLNSKLLPNNLQQRFFDDLDQLITEIESQWQLIAPQRLHGDCHPGNILWRDDNPVFVDLDDSRNGPAVQDIWMMLNGDKNDRLAQLDTILTQYQDYCKFNIDQLKLIEPLRGLRMVYYMAWLTKRWSDPAFPLAFPWFGETKYWEQQILAFEQQITQLKQPPLSLFPQW